MNHWVINEQDAGFFLLTVHTFYLQSKIKQILNILKHNSFHGFLYCKVMHTGLIVVHHYFRPIVVCHLNFPSEFHYPLI